MRSDELYALLVVLKVFERQPEGVNIKLAYLRRPGLQEFPRQRRVPLPRGPGH